MMRRMHPYALTAAALWLLAVGLTYWNLATIEAVTLANDQSERLRNELIFHRQYIGKLEAVRQAAETYVLPVDSAKLGFLAVQSHLEALAAIFGMEAVKFSRQVGETSPERLPITVALEGSFEGTVQFLNALREYPYLSITHAHLKVLNDRGQGSAEINLDFQFRLKATENIPSAPMRTTRYPTASEVSPS